MTPELEAILRLEAPIIVQIGQRSMPVEGVLSLAPGSIIELPKGSDEELELLVNNKPIGLGIAVKVGENFGLKISYIGDLKARVVAMGESGAGAAAAADAEAAAIADAMLAGQA